MSKKKEGWLKPEHYKGNTIFVSKVVSRITGEPVYTGVVVKGTYKSTKVLGDSSKHLKEIWNGKNKEEVVRVAKEFIDNPNKYQKSYPILIRRNPPK